MVPVLRNVERMNYADIEKVNGCETVFHLSSQVNSSRFIFGNAFVSYDTYFAYLSWGNNCFK